MEFTGKKVLVTGAGVGIGRAAALEFARRGAKVALTDVNYQSLEKVKEELEEYGDNILIFQCDVSDEECVNAVTKQITEAFGGIDILVNNAALWRCSSSFWETPIEEWKKFIDVNIMGVVYSTRAVIDGMISRGYGRIINVASVAGVYGNANMAHYSATKGALISMTKALAKEVADKGVTVNSVSPGSVSPSSNSDIDFHQPSELCRMGRTGTNRENAELICFLASDGAAYISGENIIIDGCRRKI